MEEKSQPVADSETPPMNEKVEPQDDKVVSDEQLPHGDGEPDITKDGLKVHPQPTGDPLDPLNWSRVRKHTILSIVMFKYVQKLWIAFELTLT